MAKIKFHFSNGDKLEAELHKSTPQEIFDIIKEIDWKLLVIATEIKGHVCLINMSHVRNFEIYKEMVK